MIDKSNDEEPFANLDPSLAEISANTLNMIDEASANFRRGIVGPVVDPARLKRLTH